MSFGFSASDAILLVQLAWNTVQNSRKAVGEHDELTHETTCLHVVLRRVEQELGSPESPLNRPDDALRHEFESLITGCKKPLRTLDMILEKYNALSQRERTGSRLWQSVRFGNTYEHVRDLRSKLSYYTSTTVLLLDTLSYGTIGRVEQQMDSTGGDLREIKFAVYGIAKQMTASSHQDGSVLTEYPGDDTAVWRAFRRELIHDGILSSVIDEHKGQIQAFIRELGDRGVLDERIPHDHSFGENGVGPDETHAQWGSTEMYQLYGHEQDAGPRYDGDYGLGSMLSVGLMEEDPMDDDANDSIGSLQVDIISDSESSSDTYSTCSSSASGSSRSIIQYTSYHQVNSHYIRPRLPDVANSGRSDTRLQLRDTALPLTTQPSNHQHPILHASPARIPQNQAYLKKEITDSIQKNEKRRKRNKYMVNCLIGRIFVAHVLASY